MSKGSKPRPTNKLQFDENYNNINWSKLKKKPKKKKEDATN